MESLNTASAGPPPDVSLVSDPDFMKFWVGQGLAVFGAQFSPLAIQIIAVRTLKVTNFQLGVLGFLNTIPFLILGLFVGVWLDRHSRRRTLMLADLGRSLVLLAIPLSYLLYAVTLNVLYVVTLAAGVLTVFFEIGYQAYVPSLVDKKKVVEANSKLEATRSSAQAAGPFAAGAVTQLASAPLAVLGDCLGYTASWVTLSRIRKPEEVSPRGGRSTVQDIREGLKVVFGDARIRAITGTTATSNFFSSAFYVVLTKFFLDDLHMSNLQVGIVYGVAALGGVLGALISLRVAERIGVGNSIILGSMIFSILSVLFYFATPSNGFVLTCAIMFVSYVGVLLYNIPQVSYRQVLVPKEIQGRMNASIRTLVWGIIPVGSIAGGLVAQAFGVRDTVALMAALTVLSPLWVIFSPVRKVRKFPTGQ